MVTRDPKRGLPSMLRVTQEEFEHFFPYWTLWQEVDRKPSEFILALQMPKNMLDVFMELDGLLDTMTRIYAEDQAKSQQRNSDSVPNK